MRSLAPQSADPDALTSSRQMTKLISSDVTLQEDLELVQRTSKLEFKENPVPPFVRKKFGLNEFAFLVKSSFYPDAFDEQ